jgi:hypothetical protein
MPIWDRQPGFNSFTSIWTDDGTRIAYGGWDAKVDYERAQPEIYRWGEANVRPHMSDVKVHQGEVAWLVRK